MPFRFQLQSVLSLRNSLERHEESILQRMQVDVARAICEVQEAGDAILNARRSWQDTLLGSTAAVQLASMLEEEKQLVLRRAALEKKLAQLTIDRDLQMSRYQQAHRDHEVLLSIRKRHLALYQRDQARTEQKSLDDMVMTRWPRN